jgi:hypothetical protein
MPVLARVPAAKSENPTGTLNQDVLSVLPTVLVAERDPNVPLHGTAVAAKDTASNKADKRTEQSCQPTHPCAGLVGFASPNSLA